MFVEDSASKRHDKDYMFAWIASYSIALPQIPSRMLHAASGISYALCSLVPYGGQTTTINIALMQWQQSAVQPLIIADNCLFANGGYPMRTPFIFPWRWIHATARITAICQYVLHSRWCYSYCFSRLKTTCVDILPPCLPDVRDRHKFNFPYFLANSRYQWRFHMIIPILSITYSVRRENSVSGKYWRTIFWPICRTNNDHRGVFESRAVTHLLAETLLERDWIPSSLKSSHLIRHSSSVLPQNAGIPFPTCPPLNLRYDILWVSS